jgi:hypothetical protein
MGYDCSSIYTPDLQDCKTYILHILRVIEKYACHRKICIVQIALVPTYWDVFSMAGLHSSVADHQTSEASSLHDVLGNVSLS